MEVIRDHLELLARNWLAAVQDYALLSLPPNFTPQLPSTGAFFSMVTSEAVKPHYDECWHVLLHATILWEGHEGVLSKTFPEAPSTQTLFATPLVSGDRSNETFSLLLGLIVKALCNASVLEVDHITKSLVVSLHHLTQALWVSQHLLKVPQIAMEILGVLHRVLLTTKPGDIHCEVLKTARSLTDTLSNCTQPLGEGIVKGVMKIVSCVIVDRVFGKEKTSSTSKSELDTVSMAISLLPPVLQLTLPPEMLPNATCVMYILLSGVAQPSLSHAFSPALLQTMTKCLKVVQQRQSNDCLPQLVGSCLSSLFERDPAASVDISSMDQATQLTALTHLLQFTALSVPPFSTAVSYIVTRMEDHKNVSGRSSCFV